MMNSLRRYLHDACRVFGVPLNIRLFILFGVLLFVVIASRADNQTTIPLIGTRVVDMKGNLLQLGMEGTVLKPIVLTFLMPNCEISNAQVQQLNRLGESAAERGLIFYGVIPGSQATWQEADQFQQQHKFGFPLILDADRNLSAQIQPTLALETVLVDKYDRVAYRGDALAVPLSQAIQRLAIDGKLSAPVVVVEASEPRCQFSPEIAPAKITYNRHIAGLLNANCAECHRPQGIGPFPLLDYSQTRHLAPMIAHVTKERIMPPWKAKPDSGYYLNERLLTEHQIKLLDLWAKSGAKEGDTAALNPPANVDTSEWRLGPPDIVISMPEAFDIPASGPDIYRYFVVKDAIPKNLEIATIDFLPGDASVVHHSNFFVDYGKKARKKDAEDPAPGFSVFGTGGFFSYWDTDNTAAGLGAWAPGGNPVRYPDGMGIKLPGGADFVFEIHYHPTGKKTRDRSRLGIYLAKKPIKQPVSALFIGTHQVDIPPGAKDYKRHFWIELPADMHIVDIGPHMHYLGTHVDVKATLPDAQVIQLLDVEWDFRWQGAYYYREPLFLPKGTRIDAITSYDNSSDNPYNPYNPPVRATWGWGTDQEMGELYITILTKNYHDSKRLQEAAFQSWIRPSDPELVSSSITTEEIIERLRYQSTWEAQGESMLRLLVADKVRTKEATRLLKQKMKQASQDARLRMIYGSFLAISAITSTSTWMQYYKYGEAASYYEKALELDNSLWDARFGLATGYSQEKGKKYQKIAEQHFLELIRQQEQKTRQKVIYAKTYQELGDLYERMGQSREAKNIWQQGNKLHPTDQSLIKRLGRAKN